MNIKNSSLLRLVSAIFLLFLMIPAHAGFMGNAVHGEYLFPDTGSVFMDLGNAVVGPGAEFTVAFDSNITVDFSDAAISITIFDANSSFNPATFSGFHFSDAFGTIDAITNVTLTSTNNFAFTASDITFDADNIFLNFQGLDVVPDSSLALVVNFASSPGPNPSPIPEPGTLALLSMGLMAWRLVRRKE